VTLRHAHTGGKGGRRKGRQGLGAILPGIGDRLFGTDGNNNGEDTDMEDS
jgi:hypothetical protein